jgi:hypothetical protein
VLRRLYGWIIRLHPQRFRDRFGQEMLSIFDDSGEDVSPARLVADGGFSVVRQWLLRSGSGIAETAEAVPWSTDGSPVFYVFGDYRPRTSSLVSGGMLTLLVFCAAWLVCEYTWTHPVFMPLVTVQFDSGPDLKAAEQSAPSPLPLQATASSPNKMISAQSGSKSALNSTEPPSVLPKSVSAPQPIQVTNAQPSVPLTAPKANRETLSASGSPAQPTRTPMTTPDILEPTLQSYTGLYTTEPPNALGIEVTVEFGRLSIQIAGEPKARLARLGGTDFMFSDSESDFIEFIKHSHGPADLVIYRNGRTLTAHRTAPHNR